LGDEKQAESGKFNFQLKNGQKSAKPKKQKTMVQKIKKIAMLLLVATTLVTFGACGDKEEENNAPDDAKLLENTHWSYSNEDEDIYVIVRFEEWKQVHVNKTYMVDGLMTQDLYDGSYTYSAGKGTMKLYVDFSSFDTFETTFSISGTTMTLNLKGETFSLTQE